MQVEFLICGAQKAGTTSLDGYCRSHPALAMPAEKELHFFDNDHLFQDRDPDYDRYHQFYGFTGGKLAGEATPVYLYWPEAAQRIHRYNPAMKLIVLLRHPAERAYSHWHMEFARGLEQLSFSDAIRQEPQRLAAAKPEQRRIWSYVDRGRYLGQLQRLWELFSREQVLVLQSDELRRAPQQALDRVSDFLDIAPFTDTGPLELNAQKYSLPLPDGDREFLALQFAEDIAGLERELGWDLAAWRR